MRQRVTRAGRTVATTAVLLAVSLLPSGVAYAVTRAAAPAEHAVTSGTWKVVPTPTQFTFVSVLSAPSPQYATVRNTGTLDLVGTTYTLSVTGLTVGTVSVRACSGTWNESTHSCGGSTTTVVTSGNTPQSVTAAGLLPDNPNDVVRLQVALNVAATLPVTVTLTTSASRSQVRAATTSAA